MMVVDQEGQAVGEHFMDTGLKGSEFKRPKTPMTPDTIADDASKKIATQDVCNSLHTFLHYIYTNVNILANMYANLIGIF